MPISRCYFLIIACLAFLTSCYVETAQPTDRRELVIASDYLTPADTILFEEFTRQNKVRIFIREISTNGIIGLIRNADYDSGLDLIMVKSVHDVYRLNQQKILHPLYEGDEEIKSEENYTSYRYNFVGIGLDPYVILQPTDSLPELTSYDELKDRKHISLLSEGDEKTFFSPLRGNLPRVEVFNWLKEWKNHVVDSTYLSNTHDSVRLILATHSSTTQLVDSIKRRFNRMTFPESFKGTFYNLRTICIVHQAENYKTAKEFINFCVNPGYNDQICRKTSIFPIYSYLKSREGTFTPYPVKAEEAMQYHSLIERVMNKLH